ncbi:unnamed protein product [Cunninghamella echinulata]
MTPSTTKRLTGSMDLLSYYNLLPCYHKYIPQTMDPTLFPFLANLPGKTSVEPDDYIKRLLFDPHVEESPSQPIQPLDLDTLKEAYKLKEGPIPGFDTSLIFSEEGEATSGNTNQYLTLDKDTNGISSDGERKHKKKKKKRKHKHEHDEDGHGDHKKKKKKKKEREHRDELEGDNVIVD